MWINNKPKSKYALVLVASNQYLPGINEMINALDYYNNQVDLHFVHDELPEKYIDEIKNADLNYRIVLNDFNDLEGSFLKTYPKLFPKDKYHIWTFLRYWYILQIKDEYKATAILDGDEMILNNITPWFEFASNTKYLMTARHHFRLSEPEDFSQNDVDNDAALPYFNHPIICNPKVWASFFEFMFERESQYHESDMRTLNKCLYLSDKMKDVFPLLDLQWIGAYIWTSKIKKIVLNNGMQYLECENEKARINVIHGKWYGHGFRINQMNGAKPCNKEIMKNNLKLICEMYKKFNLNHKVKISAIGDMMNEDWDTCYESK